MYAKETKSTMISVRHMTTAAADGLLPFLILTSQTTERRPTKTIRRNPISNPSVPQLSLKEGNFVMSLECLPKTH